MATVKKKLIKKQKKTYKKISNKNQSNSMKRLTISNSKVVEFYIFKDVFFNSAIILFKLDKTPFFSFN